MALEAARAKLLDVAILMMLHLLRAFGTWVVVAHELVIVEFMESRECAKTRVAVRGVCVRLPNLHDKVLRFSVVCFQGTRWSPAMHQSRRYSQR